LNTIQELRQLGQSVWLDFIEHSLFTSGELTAMIEDGLAGMTSNPTIFQKAIAASSDHDDLIGGPSAAESDATVFEGIAVREVTLACERFLPLYYETHGGDGYVSIEVSPRVARDTQSSIEEAERLWRAVSRPNLMVKIPGTQEGLAAIEHCLAEGLNINITLLFSVARYREVVEAYLRALERRLRDGRPLAGVASVASFFVSRVDTKVDKLLGAMAGATGGSPSPLRGRTAVANAKLAYQDFAQVLASERWQKLAAQGARPQRLLWASTSTKDPSYPDTYYADALAGPHTVDTMTRETFRAYLDHGRPRARITEAPEEARAQMAALVSVGIDLKQITDALEDEGVRAFSDSYAKALASIAEKRRKLGRSRRGGETELHGP
jgi:transaldolase